MTLSSTYQIFKTELLDSWETVLTVLFLLLMEDIKAWRFNRWQSDKRLLVEDLDFSSPWTRNFIKASSMNDSGTFGRDTLILPI